MQHGVYRGRFAPSPTGPLHLGSLVAAVASFADARHHGGEWLVRIEDVDETRARPGADQRILHTLETFGMFWDAQPVWQSSRKAAYDEAIATLLGNGQAYRCNCSRKTVAAVARVGPEGPVYPGLCRNNPPPASSAAALRVSVDATRLAFGDRIVGEIRQDLARDVGDFVVRRLDGFTAYQLAVVVDDQQQGITDIVRGADLLWSTPRQVYLQTLLGYRTPRYAHVPLVYGIDGHKLSKRDAAHPIDDNDPLPALSTAWRHLGQGTIPREVDDVPSFWQWAIPRWDIAAVPQDMNSRHEHPDTL